MTEKIVSSIIALFFIVLGLSLIFGGMWGCPKWKVYQKELSGKAALKEAEWDRQITIEEARAEVQAAVYKKTADSLRAIGVAEANQIISKSITPEYVQWKWVESLHKGQNEVIYIPTEANMPILEMNRLSEKK